MRPLIIQDIGLFMVLAFQSFSWCCCCDLYGMINKLMSLFQFSFDCYLVDSLWAIQTLSIHFQGVVSLCQCHQRSWAQWSFQNHHRSCNNPHYQYHKQSLFKHHNYHRQLISEKVFFSFFRKKCGKYIWLPKSCHRDVELQKLLVSIHKSEK